MIAFIGVGKIALEHLKVLDKFNIKVNFAYSKSIKSKSWKIFKEKSSSTIFQENIIKILNNKKIKFIFFFLPWNVNNTYLNINHNHNKIYFYEKPLALDLKQLDKLKNYKKNNILAGYNRRFYNTVNKLKNRILKGGLISVDVNISEDLNNLISRHGKSVLKYSLEYSSCHILDLVFYLFGNIKIIKVYKIKTQYSNEGFFNFKITAENIKKSTN